MLTSTLKADWPQQYIAYLEDKLIFRTEDDVHQLPEAAGGTAGSELVVWKPGDSTGDSAVL